MVGKVARGTYLVVLAVMVVAWVVSFNKPAPAETQAEPATWLMYS
jgi:hypothetical protein